MSSTHLLRRRLLAELERHRPRLGLQVGEHLVERRLPEVQPAFERRLDLHVEPGLDRTGEELHRHRVDEGARRKRHQRKEQRQAKREARPEHARAHAAPQRRELPGREQREQPRERRVHAEQQRVVARKQRRVAGRGGEEKKRDPRECRPDGERERHRASASRGSRASTGAGAGPP
ncbi:MAG: hypothetical protein RML56_03620 [Burkholderiales bacterium]|nr:hypothetical protein [Burkholderiales bacterium]